MERCPNQGPRIGYLYIIGENAAGVFPLATARCDNISKVTIPNSRNVSVIRVTRLSILVLGEHIPKGISHMPTIEAHAAAEWENALHGSYSDELQVSHQILRDLQAVDTIMPQT